MDRLLAIEAFVRVAESHSFVEAARQLGVSKSVITTRVQHLEELIRTSLFLRSTRSVRLSDAGQAYFQQCADLVQQAGNIVDGMRGMVSAPAGLLRVHALPGFALGHFGGLLRGFQERYPEITLDLVVSDAIVDPVREGFDCALQIFEPVSSALVAKKLFSWRPVFCASPDYLHRTGTPKEPGEMLGHRLGLYSRYPTRNRWTFTRGKKKIELDLKPFLRTNSVHLLRDYARAGAGIVCIPTLLAAEDLIAGRLIALFPKYRLPSFWLSAVYPLSHGGSTKLKLFLQSLSAGPNTTPPWERELVALKLLPTK